MSVNEETGDGATSPPDALQNFIFYRELAEVYLLVDNISTTLGKSLPVPRPPNPPGDPGEPDWVSDICAIGWPPHGSEAELNTQAATLIKARDRLNNVAAPATGYTIAFTLLVAGEQSVREPRDQRSRRGAAKTDSDAELNETVAAFLGGSGQGQSPPSRFVLANIAYPGLRKLARRFVVFKYALMVGLFLLFLVTSVMSWNIATGNALLSQYAALEAAVAGAGSAETPVAKSTRARGDNSQSRSASEQRLQQLALAQNNLHQWSLSWTFLSWILPDMNKLCPADPAGASGCPPANGPWISTFLGVLGGAVLPIFYGALGGGVAVMRSLSAHIRDSRLAPRHMTLFLVQLVLGAILGGCIGLFATPSSAAPGQAPGLLGAVPLSASALCFLAGFSVEGVFQALDGFIRRVFNLSDPSQPPARRSPQGSSIG